MRWRKKDRRRKNRIGCGFLLLTCIVTCVLLLLNAALVASVYFQMAPVLPPIFQNRKVAQVLLYLLPVGLTLLEWWLLDLLIDRLTRLRAAVRSSRQEGADSGAGS